MTRMFLTLYLLLITALAGYWFITVMVPGVILTPMGLDYAHQNYQGTRHLLERRIAGLSTGERQVAVEKIQQHFEYPIGFVEEASLNLDEKSLALLEQGKLAENEVDEADQGVYRSSVNGMAWVFESDQNATEHNRRISIGTFRLFEELLLNTPEQQMAEVMADLNDQFGFPVATEPLTLIELEEEQKATLLEHQVVGLNINTDDERYYYLSDKLPSINGNKQVIRFGPIDFPISTPLLVASLLLVLALMIAIAIGIWINPVWSGMTSLAAATRRFGEGDFSARVQLARRSGIQQIGSEFNQMAERIENLLGSHRELTNAVSHELRTPLSRMRFSMEMLQTADADVDRERHLRDMSVDIDELDTLVSELLTYARFDRDPALVRSEKIYLPSWLDSEINRLRSCVDEHLTLSLDNRTQDQKMMIYAEARLLGRAISNLVQNAARYAHSSVAVSLTADKHQVRLAVEDDGPGIPANDREKVFDAFYRLDQSRNRQSGGAGLGLSIVRQIVEWHQGEVYVEDGVSGGARFVMTLPVADNQE